MTGQNRISQLYSLEESVRVLPNKYAQLVGSRNIHFIWIGSAPQRSHQVNLVAWKRVNKSANIYLWTDEDLQLLPNGPWSDTKLHPAQRADLLRVWLVYIFGGWYVDIDCVPGRHSLPFDQLIIFAREDGRRFQNCIFYSEMLNPFFEHWGREMSFSVSEDCYTSIAEQTGPIALSRAIYTWNQLTLKNTTLPSGRILDWSEFTHLPSTLFRSNKWILFIGKYSLHFGMSSWDQGTEFVTKYRHFKQLFYLARHSPAEPMFEFIRLAITKQLPPKKDLPFRVWRLVVGSADLAYIRNSGTIRYSPAKQWTNQNYVEVTRDLATQVLILSTGEGTRAQLNLGWTLIQTKKFDYLVRPKITQIIP